MKKVFLLLFLLLICFDTACCQYSGTEWKEPEMTSIEMEEGTYTYDNLKFIVGSWEPKATESPNMWLGAIRNLEIYKNGKLLQIIPEIKEQLGLDSIHFMFFDFNMDGYPDFRVPRDCGKSCWYDYYIFNPNTNKFEKQDSWDWVRVHSYNSNKKQILGEIDGTAREGTQELYQVKGLKIEVIKTIKIE